MSTEKHPTPQWDELTNQLDAGDVTIRFHLWTPQTLDQLRLMVRGYRHWAKVRGSVLGLTGQDQHAALSIDRANVHYLREAAQSVLGRPVPPPPPNPDRENILYWHEALLAELDKPIAMTHERDFQRLAVEQARKSVGEDNRAHPKVGAVVVRDGKMLAAAHRGELAPGDHAEYTALEKKLPADVLAGSTVYTTLEPCTSRNHPKVPCARRLIDRKIKRVVIGMLDPNPLISGKGVQLLRDHNIQVDLFPTDLMDELEELNRDFKRAQSDPESSQSGETGITFPDRAARRTATDMSVHASGKAGPFVCWGRYKRKPTNEEHRSIQERALQLALDCVWPTTWHGLPPEGTEPVRVLSLGADLWAWIVDWTDQEPEFRRMAQDFLGQTPAVRRPVYRGEPFNAALILLRQCLESCGLLETDDNELATLHWYPADGLGAIRAAEKATLPALSATQQSGATTSPPAKTGETTGACGKATTVADNLVPVNNMPPPLSKTTCEDNEMSDTITSSNPGTGDRLRLQSTGSVVGMVVAGHSQIIAPVSADTVREHLKQLKAMARVLPCLYDPKPHPQVRFSATETVRQSTYKMKNDLRNRHGVPSSEDKSLIVPACNYPQDFITFVCQLVILTNEIDDWLCKTHTKAGFGIRLNELIVTAEGILELAEETVEDAVEMVKQATAAAVTLPKKDGNSLQALFTPATIGADGEATSALPEHDGHPFGKLVLAEMHLFHFRSAMVGFLDGAPKGDESYSQVFSAADAMRKLHDEGLADWLAPVMGPSSKLWTLQLITDIETAQRLVWIGGHAIGSINVPELQRVLDSLFQRYRELAIACRTLERTTPLDATRDRSSVLRNVGIAPNAAEQFSEDGPPAAPPPAKVYSSPDTFDRDEWIFQQRQQGQTWQGIMTGLQELASKKNWEPLYSENACRDAVKRIAQYHGRKVPSGKPGRPRKTPQTPQ